MFTLNVSYRTLCFVCISLVMASSAAPAAAAWPDLPIACLPERAQKWQDGKPEPQQEPCHCPPTSMCPATYAEYINNSRAKMPMGFVMRCCDMPPPPMCEPGTDKEGQIKPDHGDCNVYCPSGTAHAGTRVRHAPGGNCNHTPPLPCPTKWYPSVNESGMSSGGNFTGVYNMDNGQQFAFDEYFSNDFGFHLTETLRLSQRFGWSLRKSNAQQWVWGPLLCDEYAFDTGNGCAFGGGYSPLTGGTNTGWSTLAELLGQMPNDNTTWFGISLARIEYLADNLATPEMVAQFNGSPFITVADNSTYVGVRYANDNIHIGGPIEAEREALVSQCRAVQGEYLALEYKNVEGQSCPYIQCRYIYESEYESCLAADVKVTLGNGSLKQASQLVVGDTVKTAEGVGTIKATNQYRSKERVLYGINGSDALITGDHPIRTTDGWKVISENAAKIYADKTGFAATKLAVGDTLITLDGDVKVHSLKRVPNLEPVSTYNIKIESNQSFYANGIEVKGFDTMQMQYK